MARNCPLWGREGENGILLHVQNSLLELTFPEIRFQAPLLVDLRRKLPAQQNRRIERLWAIQVGCSVPGIPPN